MTFADHLVNQCQRKRSYVWNPSTRVFTRICICSMCQPWCWRWNRYLEDRILDCRSVYYSIEYCLPVTNNHSCAAGISIAIGLIRICFPESQSFIEARKSGKRTMNAGEFWRETVSMLGKEWRMCIYCVILMTWVCHNRYSGSYQHLSNLSRVSSISIPTHPKIRTPHSCSLQRSLITKAPHGLLF